MTISENEIIELIESKNLAVTKPSTDHKRLIEFAKDQLGQDDPSKIIEVSYHQLKGYNENLQCHDNVKRAVSDHGGEQIFGWCIDLVEELYLEAEFHSVWKKDGKILDITPHPHKTRVFVFDDNLKYQGKSVGNRFHPLIKHPIIDAMIAHKSLSDWINSNVAFDGEPRTDFKAGEEQWWIRLSNMVSAPAGGFGQNGMEIQPLARYYEALRLLQIRLKEGF